MKIPGERLQYVEKLYLKGRSTRAIQELTSKKFGVKPRQVRNYLQIVRAKLAALPKPDPEAARVRAEHMFLEAYKLAKQGGKFGPDAKGMVAAVTRLAELDGLLTKRIDHSGAVTITPDALLADIQAASRRGSQANPGAVPEAQTTDAEGSQGDSSTE